MQRDDNLCIGAIMEASYQTRRVTQGIIEMVEYLRYNPVSYTHLEAPLKMRYPSHK